VPEQEPTPDVEAPPNYRVPGIWMLVLWLFVLRIGIGTVIENVKYLIGWVFVAFSLWKIIQWSVIRRKIRELRAAETVLPDQPLPRF